VSDFHRCIDELNLDLQRVHEWAAANGLKLNPLTLLIGSDIIKVVPKVNNLDFVLNERSLQQGVSEGILDFALLETTLHASF
jgi:hypothetical protein